MASPQQSRKWWRGKNLTDKVHSCDECDFQSVVVSVLQKHNNITHDCGQAIKYCECDYEKRSKKDFAIHMRDIHIPRVFMCDQCDNTASKEEYLKRYIKFNHDGLC